MTQVLWLTPRRFAVYGRKRLPFGKRFQPLFALDGDNFFRYTVGVGDRNYRVWHNHGITLINGWLPGYSCNWFSIGWTWEGVLTCCFGSGCSRR